MIRTVDTLTAEALIDYNSPLERQCASNLNHRSREHLHTASPSVGLSSVTGPVQS